MSALSYTQHMRGLLVLGLPLMGSHMAQLAITLTDAVMLGWYDLDALAAQVLASSIFFSILIVGSGFAWAVMPLVAAAQASGQEAQIRRVTRMGAWASMGFATLFLPVMFFAEPLLRALGQEDQIARLGGVYLWIAGWGLFPALLVMVLKSYLAALERTQVVLWVTLAAVALNMVLNYALIFGRFGMPELGLRGAAIASVLVHLASCIVLAVYAMRRLPEHALFQRIWRPDWDALGQVFRLGWPIGITSFAETSLFMMSSVMMGWIGSLHLAAHGIALQAVSVMFMLHMGLSNAATVRAGQAFGRRDERGLRDGSKVAIALSTAIALMTIVLFLALPEPIIALFMNPEEPQREAVLAIGVSLLAAAALFQLTDAAQVLALGLLRGVQDTRVPMWIASFSYWGIGIPMSYVLGFVLGFEGVGIWLGLAIGLACAAGLLMMRFWGGSARIERPA